MLDVRNVVGGEFSLKGLGKCHIYVIYLSFGSHFCHTSKIRRRYPRDAGESMDNWTNVG